MHEIISDQGNTAVSFGPESSRMPSSSTWACSKHLKTRSGKDHIWILNIAVAWEVQASPCSVAQRAATWVSGLTVYLNMTWCVSILSWVMRNTHQWHSSPASATEIALEMAFSRARSMTSGIQTAECLPWLLLAVHIHRIRSSMLLMDNAKTIAQLRLWQNISLWYLPANESENWK